MTSPVDVPDLGDADPVARLIAWLRQHQRVLAEFGGADHVSGQNKDPYPHLRVAPSDGGSDGDLRHLIKPEVSIEVYGPLDGTMGQSALRRLLYGVALPACMELVEAPTLPGQAVVSGIESSTRGRWAPEPLTAQPAWRATLIVSIHPPDVVA